MGLFDKMKETATAAGVLKEVQEAKAALGDVLHDPKNAVKEAGEAASAVGKNLDNGLVRDGINSTLNEFTQNAKVAVSVVPGGAIAGSAMDAAKEIMSKLLDNPQFQRSVRDAVQTTEKIIGQEVPVLSALEGVPRTTASVAPLKGPTTPGF